MEPHFFLGYIDPGTGSMLLTVILGVVTALVFIMRGLLIKFKVRLQGGKITGDKDKMPFVIFSDHKRYWNIFEDICDEFEKRQTEVHYMTASSDDPALSKPYKYVKTEFIGEGGKCFARLNMMKASICLSTTPGLDVLQWKRSKDVDWYVHVYHSIDDSTGYRMFALDYYDAVLATGNIQIPTLRKLEELRNTEKKEIVIVGSTYMDRLAKKACEGRGQADVPADFIAKAGECTYKADGTGCNSRAGMSESFSAGTDGRTYKTVLLAPSWGPSSILNRFGEKIITSLINTGYKIVIRPHPQSKTSDRELLESLQSKFPETELLKWNYDNDNFKVLSESDIMISDFSSVMFDYAFTFNRPFIYADTSFDSAPYEAAWFEELPWHMRMLPRIGVELKEEDFVRIKAVIDSVADSEEFAKNIAEIKNEAWSFKGEATKRTVDYLINKYNSELKFPCSIGEDIDEIDSAEIRSLS